MHGCLFHAFLHLNKMYANFFRIECVIFWVLLFWCVISNTNGINADVYLKIPDGGFHRKVKYDIDFGNFNEENCHVSLYFEFPSSFYINVDEISDLVRAGEITACSEGEFDVELFAEKAGRQNVTICSSLIGSKVSLSLPIHQRYHEAREGGGYLELKLPKPQLLLGCSNRVKEFRVSKLRLCSPCFDFAEKWRQVPYKLHPEDYVWHAPVGDTLMLPLVTWVTNVVVTCGTIYVLWTLYKVNVSNERKAKKS